MQDGADSDAEDRSGRGKINAHCRSWLHHVNGHEPRQSIRIVGAMLRTHLHHAQITSQFTLKAHLLARVPCSRMKENRSTDGVSNACKQIVATNDVGQLMAE